MTTSAAAGRTWRARSAMVAAALVVAALPAVATTLPAGPAAAAPEVTRAVVRPERPAEVRLRQARLFALRQLARAERRLPPGRFPTVAPGGRWHTSGTNGWLAGFHPGQLWMAYEASGRPVWARRAATRQAPLEVRQHDTSTHDLGFLLQTSFGRGSRLTGDLDAAAVTGTAAESLASRWVPSVGALRSWNGPPGQVTVIVDNLVNLELLFAAAHHTGRTDWADLAHRHALLSARHHVRGDGSTVHVVRFDERSGQPVWKGTAQGLADSSTWARGQSWAVYGFTAAYRQTGDRRLLSAARRTAGFAVRNLPPDRVPFWDYDARPGRHTPRDTTAAAALAAGLLDLAVADPDPQRRRSYARSGRAVLRALAGPRYLARGTGSPAVLRHGHHNATYPDSGVVYGDHYFLESLLRAQLLPSGRPALPAALLPTPGSTTADLGAVRPVSAVSVRSGDGAATRLRIETSRDGRTWVRARGAVSSGRSAAFETYDVRDRTARYVRVSVLGPGAVSDVRVRG